MAIGRANFARSTSDWSDQYASRSEVGFFASGTRKVPKWKMLAASTADAPPPDGAVVERLAQMLERARAARGDHGNARPRESLRA